MNHELELTVRQTGDRNSTRKLVVQAFLVEEPGGGKGTLTSRCRYNVETLRDGRRVYLTRPAWLKNGFDFLIHLEGTVFANGHDNPSHNDILGDLAAKHGADPQSYRRLHEALRRVHPCEDPENILGEYADVSFGSGLPVGAILKTVKWFFIEQDIRYWNYSGRNMLMSGIHSIR